LPVGFFLSGDASSDEPATEPETTENADDALVFRWFDAKGNAFDTTDTSTIPPGARFEVKGGLLKKVDLHRRRSWWRARKNRLQAELHRAQDELARAQGDFDSAAAERRSRPNSSYGSLKPRVCRVSSKSSKRRPSKRKFRSGGSTTDWVALAEIDVVPRYVA